MKLLWVDDDSPKKVTPIEGFQIATAKSCEEAEKILNGEMPRPDWIIVDLVMMQGNWKAPPYFKMPGLQYTQHLRQRYGDDVGIIVYSYFVSPELRKKALESGAKEAYSKPVNSWVAIVESLRNGRAAD